MACGINLGFLLICFLQALRVCCSRALHQGGGSWTRNTNSPVDLRHVHGSFGGGRPQDEFRQAYVVKGSSVDTRAQQGLLSKKNAASQARHNPSVQYYLSSQLPKPRWHKVDSNGEVPRKQSFGRSSVAGSSASDSSNPHKGLVWTLPGQQGTPRTGQYAPSKPDVHGPKAIPHQHSGWKPHGTGKVHQKPGLDKSAQLNGKGGFNPPKEFMKSTSGLSRGRKVYPKGVPTKLSSSTSHLNPVVSNIRERYELPISHHFGLHQSHQVSAYNQNPQLVSLHTGSSLAALPMTDHKLQSERLSPGQQFAPTLVHRIPWPYGGFPIKRLEDEDPMEQATTTKMPKKPVTRKPTKMYTFPPRQTESFRPRRPLVHKKSKWMRVKSNQLAGFPGVLVSTL